MTSYGVNDKNDLYVGPNGNLAIVTGLDAVLQDCEHVAKTQLGELVLQTDRGIPYDDAVFNNLNIGAFEQALINEWLQVPGVVAVTNIATEKVGSNVEYVATIQTIYGSGEING